MHNSGLFQLFPLCCGFLGPASVTDTRDSQLVPEPTGTKLSPRQEMAHSEGTANLRTLDLGSTQTAPSKKMNTNTHAAKFARPPSLPQFCWPALDPGPQNRIFRPISSRMFWLPCLTVGETDWHLRGSLNASQVAVLVGGWFLPLPLSRSSGIRLSFFQPPHR